MILVDGTSVDFSYLVQDGDHISVYPVFETPDITPMVRVRPRPLRESRCVLDSHLGKSAAHLRMLSSDALYRNDFADEELALISSQGGGILLTWDRGLLKRSMVTHGYCVRESHPRQQIVEVLRRFDLFNVMVPFSRCLRCNGSLEKVPKEAIVGRLPPLTREYYDDFSFCSKCDQIYWRGSHYQRMEKSIAWVREQSG